MSEEFQGDGFVLSWTRGDPTGDGRGPFKDASQDLRHLALTKLDDRYQVRATTIVDGFRGPVDAEMIGNKIFVISTNETDVWEITMPAGDGTAVEESREARVPERFSLEQNYPHPFNSITVIGFDLPTRSRIELAIYNLAGQKVVTLVDGAREAGVYTIHGDGRDRAGHALGNGVYLYRLETGDKEQTRKLLLLQ